MRIQIAILTGSHDPNPLVGAILCDVSDEPGSFTIPAQIVDAFLALPCMEVNMRCSRVTRYRRATLTGNLSGIELFVGSARALAWGLY